MLLPNIPPSYNYFVIGMIFSEEFLAHTGIILSGQCFSKKVNIFLDNF